MEKSVRLEPGREKLIVMPFVPEKGQAPDGIGLGLHFLVGNVVCLHPALLECWFGWRVSQIFPDKGLLLAHDRGQGRAINLEGLGLREKVRFWISGAYVCPGPGGGLSLCLHDTRDRMMFNRAFPFNYEDGLLGLRRAFYHWLGEIGLGFSGQDLGLWPERISSRGLDLLGQALETLYVSYVDKDSPMAISLFEDAVSASPASYLAQDLLGWGRYKLGDLEGAGQAFEAALALNPDGMGAHAGRMWLALAHKDRDAALAHAMEKGRCRGEAPEKARDFVAKKLG